MCLVTTKMQKGRSPFFLHKKKRRTASLHKTKHVQQYESYNNGHESEIVKQSLDLSCSFYLHISSHGGRNGLSPS